MPRALLYHSLAFAMSCTSYFAVRNPKNIVSSSEASCTYPAVDVAAETSTRPARYANKHRNANIIVIVETCFNFPPRTGLTSAGETFAATVSVGIDADLLRRRLAGLAVDLMRGMLLLLDSVPTATVAISTNDLRSGPDASPVHTSAANSLLAP